MLRKFLRYISILLSFASFGKNKINNITHEKTEKLLIKNLPSFFLKNPRLSTHKNLSNEILKIISKRKLKSFLRNSFIQNIFFIHNRLFIYFELKELKKDKKWNLWKKLILDNSVGDPIRYFLYSDSTGNRIRQVYILKKFLENNEQIILNKIKRVLEIGGGYGCMADIFLKLQKNTKYTIYDMFEVNLLQFYYLKMNGHEPKLNKISGKLSLINNINNLNKFVSNPNDYLFIANWSISEFPYHFRKKFFVAIKNAKFSIISFQENFEKINNKKFFDNILKKLGKNYISQIHPFKYYNRALFNSNKHYMITIVKK